MKKNFLLIIALLAFNYQIIAMDNEQGLIAKNPYSVKIQYNNSSIAGAFNLLADTPIEIITPYNKAFLCETMIRHGLHEFYRNSDKYLDFDALKLAVLNCYLPVNELRPTSNEYKENIIEEAKPDRIEKTFIIGGLNCLIPISYPKENALLDIHLSIPKGDSTTQNNLQDTLLETAVKLLSPIYPKDLNESQEEDTKDKPKLHAHIDLTHFFEKIQFNRCAFVKP